MAQKQVILINPAWIPNGPSAPGAVASFTSRDFPDVSMADSAVLYFYVSAITGAPTNYIFSVDERDPLSGGWVLGTGAGGLGSVTITATGQYVLRISVPIGLTIRLTATATGGASPTITFYACMVLIAQGE